MYIKADDKDKNIEELLLNYFFGENNDNGLFIGYRLYNKYMVSAYQTDRIELYSNVLKSRTCEVGNICVKRPGVQLDFENARVIEALEIMQNYYNIEQLNKLKFCAFFFVQFIRKCMEAADRRRGTVPCGMRRNMLR